MGIVENEWHERRVRVEQGIYYADDHVSELCGDPAKGYHVDLRAPVTPLARANPAGWALLIHGCTARAGEWNILAGATSWEGHGFLAVERASSGELLWLLHAHESEEFVEVSSDGEMIRAVSGDYPAQFVWKIPIAEPEALTVAAMRSGRSEPP